MIYISKCMIRGSVCGYIPYLDQTLIVLTGTIEPSYSYSLKGNKLPQWELLLLEPYLWSYLNSPFLTVQICAGLNYPQICAESSLKIKIQLVG